MISAATRGVVDIELMEFLIKSLPEDEMQNYINTKDNEGNTLLHYCCLNTYTTAFRFALHYGGDVNAKNNSGLTPFDYAIENRQFDLFRVVVRAKGGKKFLTNNNGKVLDRILNEAQVD
eukprot:Pgem_evm1s11366